MEQDNKMTSSNLGIVFGPTLMRPRPTDATISLSSLVDYPHQARIIEALIIFYSTIFENKEAPLLADPSKYTADTKEEAASGTSPVRVQGKGAHDLPTLGRRPEYLPGTFPREGFAAAYLAPFGSCAFAAQSSR